jgi:hypothetical protein
MTLKPAHLSYKCTVCTATFGMYKLFENHVYSAHSTVAKKDNKSKSSTSTAGSSGGAGNSLLKPLRINDEITIIPQPAKKMSDIESHVIGENCRGILGRFDTDSSTFFQTELIRLQR